jgi:2-oxoglutarate ferredoxin oxidoreductase subunit beta
VVPDDPAALNAFALEGQLVTGMLYLDPKPEDLHRHLNTCDAPVNRLSENEVCPGSAALEKINARLR